MYYPRYENPNFTKILHSKKELNDNAIEKVYDRSLKNYQYMASNYLNPMSPYKSLLLHYSTGVGKTLSAISVAENFIKAKKGKVLVLTKNEIVENSFRNQIIKGFPGYASKEDIKLLNLGGDVAKEIYKKYSLKVNRNYEFVHFETFNNQVQGKTLQNLAGGRGASSLYELNNYLVIIDEVHNIVKKKVRNSETGQDSNGYVSIKNILEKSKNIRLLLLSATPMHDKVEEIFQISNLLNFDRPEYQINSLDVVKEGLMTSVRNKIPSVTKKGEDFLRGALKSKVLYLKTDISNFPLNMEIGERLPYKDVLLKTKLITCPMSRYQSKGFYTILENEKGNFGVNYENASSIIYPRGIEYSTFTRKMINENLKEYSSKLYEMIENISNSVGKVFVYSSSVNQSGVELIAKCLYAKGITSFATITSNTEDINRSRIISRFNNIKNINGKDLKILIGSKVIAEGITLKEVREVHLYEPFWNLSSIDQVIGRAIRNGSHARLPKEERDVAVFKYCAVPLSKKSSKGSNGTPKLDFDQSFDLLKYSLAEEKDIEIKKIERLVAKSSFGCFLNKPRNIMSRYSDNSRQCDYTDCNYTCDWEGNPEIDIDTYQSKYHNGEGYQKLKKILSGILSSNQPYSITDLKNTINRSNKLIDLDVAVEDVLDSLIEDGELKKHGKYYIIHGKNTKKNEIYLKDLSKSSKGSSNNTGPSKSSKGSSNNAGPSKPKTPPKNVPKTINIKGKIFGLDDLRGFMKDGKFSLIGGISEKGKLCTGFDKKSLVSILASVGIYEPGTTQQLCDALKKKLLK